MSGIRRSIDAPATAAADAVALGVGEAEARGNARHVVGDEAGERGKPRRRGRREIGGAFEGDEALEGGEIADAAKDHGQDARLLHGGGDRDRALCHDQLAHFLADALGGKFVKAVAGAHGGGETRRVDLPCPIGRVKTEEAENAQAVFRDARAGRADEADAAGENIRVAADRIVHAAAGIDGKRVDGEIPAERILPPVGAEPDDRVAAVGLDILAERRHLEAAPADDQRHRAVVDAGGDDPDTGGFGGGNHAVWRRGGGEIDVADRLAHQGIPHRAAHDSRLAQRREQVENPPDGAFGEPGGPGKVWQWLGHKAIRWIGATLSHMDYPCLKCRTCAVWRPSWRPMSSATPA